MPLSVKRVATLTAENQDPQEGPKNMGEAPQELVQLAEMNASALIVTLQQLWKPSQ
jgi:hypothetical protein